MGAITTAPIDMPIIESARARARCASNQRATIVIAPSEDRPPITNGSAKAMSAALTQRFCDNPMPTKLTT